ncbi:MAG: hypothetical protein ACT4QF_14055 [Sporichthyaceae bacterium]
MQHKLTAATLATGLAISAVTAVIVLQDEKTGSESTTAEITSAASTRPEVEVLSVSGSDHLPSQSAEDWVTYADHVVSAKAVRQTIGEPAPEELRRGEGAIPRTVTYEVDDVVWSRSNATKAAPSTFDLSAYGFAFRNGDSTNRIPMASRDVPRGEIGHTYIFALVWEDARCSPGDPVTPAQWRPLGSHSILPFDDKIVGKGENAGRVQDVEQARAAADPKSPNYGLEEQMAGKGRTELRAELDKATPQKREVFSLPAPCA